MVTYNYRRSGAAGVGVAAVALLVGCAPLPDASFAHRGSMERVTTGVVLSDDGSTGHAGMYGTNCPFVTSTGAVMADYDVDEDREERVDDLGPGKLGVGTVVLTVPEVPGSPGVVHLIDHDEPDEDHPRHEQVRVAGLVEARLSGGDVVALSRMAGGGCGVTFDVMFRSVRVDVPDARCEQFALHPERPLAVLAGSQGGLHFVGPHGGWSVADVPSAAVVVQQERVITGENRRIVALDLGGELAWDVSLDGELRSLAVGGSLVHALVARDGRGELVAFDARTGARRGAAVTPSADATLIASANGDVVGVVLADAAHFFNVLGDAAARPE